MSILRCGDFFIFCWHTEGWSAFFPIHEPRGGGEKSATQKIKFEFQKLLRHSKSEETQSEYNPHLTDMIGSILAAIFKNKN